MNNRRSAPRPRTFDVHQFTGVELSEVWTHFHRYRKVHGRGRSRQCPRFGEAIGMARVIGEPRMWVAGLALLADVFLGD